MNEELKGQPEELNDQKDTVSLFSIEELPPAPPITPDFSEPTDAPVAPAPEDKQAPRRAHAAVPESGKRKKDKKKKDSRLDVAPKKKVKKTKDARLDVGEKKSGGKIVLAVVIVLLALALIAGGVFLALNYLGDSGSDRDDDRDDKSSKGESSYFTDTDDDTTDTDDTGSDPDDRDDTTDPDDRDDAPVTNATTSVADSETATVVTGSPAVTENTVATENTDAPESSRNDTVSSTNVPDTPVTVDPVWTISGNTLTVSGCTVIPDYVDENGYPTDTPWKEYSANITSVVIEDGITDIGENAFYWLSSVESITIPDSVTTVGKNAFYHCTMLTEVNIPSSVTSIGFGAFSSCEGLREIRVERGNGSYCDVDGVLFTKDMKTLVNFPAGKVQDSYTVPNGVETLADWSFDYCKGLGEIILPDSLKAIGEAAFCECYGLTSITIPKSVTTLDERVFAGSNNIVTFDVDEENPAYCDVDGVLFTKDMKTLVAYPCGNPLASYAVSSEVKSISSYAFFWCENLTGIMIPASVTDIGESAFWGCSALNDIYYGGTSAVWKRFGINVDVPGGVKVHCSDASIDQVQMSFLQD